MAKVSARGRLRRNGGGVKRSSVYGLVAVILVIAGGGAFLWWSEKLDQKCTDATRMQNLFAIAQMVEDYHDEQDRYPFQGDAAAAHVALDEAFFDELQRVLDAPETQRLIDRQNDFSYRVGQDGYTLTTHLHASAPQTTELDPQRHRLQVGSAYDPVEKLYPFVDISVNSILAASQAVADYCR